MLKKRASGILLHISSLPSEYGVGDLGPQAYRFADFLVKARQSYWQVLPINPPTVEGYHSPYNSLSAFAGNSLFISPQLLLRQGLLTRKEIQNPRPSPKANIDYHLVISYKKKLLNTAFQRFKSMPGDSNYNRFCSENKRWLEDFAMFVALRDHFGSGLWYKWPPELRDRRKEILKTTKSSLNEGIEREKFFQYQFFRQWFSLKNYCSRRGIGIIGDIPIYVAFDSADAWAHQEIFKLTKAKRPRLFSGVPPDFFSRTGQLWGNPVYDWKALKNTDYSWWLERIRHNFTLFDIIRLDHFRGLISCWEVPASHKTAEKGKWKKAGGEDFFKKLLKHFPERLLIVEDIGHITDDVRAAIEKFALTGMKILQYGFGGTAADNPHCPYNFENNSVVYTGTHDNNTTRGWFEKEAKSEQKKRLFDYLGRSVSGENISWELIRLALSSVSRLCIIPMQDVLGLGSKARMNKPGSVKGNWRWHLRKEEITGTLSGKLARLTKIYGRG
ncbi:MAG: 4-alpha-glucanotransferase [Planctomycetota bacterium]|jgi:4-alpha-glucanotransferase